MSRGEGSNTRQAAVLAGHTGDTRAVTTLLTHPDPRVREAAIGALRRCSALSVVELANQLDWPGADSRLRRRALRELVALDADEPIDPMTAAELIEPLLTDPDHHVAETAAFAAGETCGPATVPALASMATTHEDSLCREAAVAALGSIGDESGLDAILSATTDIAPIRRRATLALAAFDHETAADRLAELTEDRDRVVRQSATDLMAIIRPAAP